MADAHKERVGAAIRERREELDLSQRELAAKIPVTEKTLRRWESGESFGHMDNLERLAELLNTTVDRLMAGPAKQKGPTPDPFAASSNGGSDSERLARIEHKLNRLLALVEDADLATALGDLADSIRRGPPAPPAAGGTATG